MKIWFPGPSTSHELLRPRPWYSAKAILTERVANFGYINGARQQEWDEMRIKKIAPFCGDVYDFQEHNCVDLQYAIQENDETRKLGSFLYKCYCWCVESVCIEELLEPLLNGRWHLIECKQEFPRNCVYFEYRDWEE